MRYIVNASSPIGLLFSDLLLVCYSYRSLVIRFRLWKNYRLVVHIWLGFFSVGSISLLEGFPEIGDDPNILSFVLSSRDNHKINLHWWKLQSILTFCFLSPMWCSFVLTSLFKELIVHVPKHFLNFIESLLPKYCSYFFS